MNDDILSIAVYAACQLIYEATEMYVVFVLTPFGPIIEIERANMTGVR